jgi:hypothetical protein
MSKIKMTFMSVDENHIQIPETHEERKLRDSQREYNVRKEKETLKRAAKKVKEAEERAAKKAKEVQERAEQEAKEVQ